MWRYFDFQQTLEPKYQFESSYFIMYLFNVNRKIQYAIYLISTPTPAEVKTGL